MVDFFIANTSDRQRVHIAIDKHEVPCRVRLSKGGKRSTEQNSYLWGVCYATILEHGLKEKGFRAEDLHEYFLGEFHGWEVVEGAGIKRKKPVERSSGKTKMEFSEYIGYIHQWAAERLGIFIPDPI